MIPKTIHYCWFGRNPLPADAVKCINSWKKHLSDYEIKEWNEDNFDVNTLPYTKQAYEARKFAFVTDYVRLHAMYSEGGIYMDTDVEVCGSYDQFLHHPMFSGFETDNNVPTGMMASEKSSIWAKELLDEYIGRHFLLEDGSYDQTTNTTVITRYMLSKGLVLNNTLQNIEGLCVMYPAEYFCPKDHRTGEITKTKNTVCIHHFAGSWLNPNFIQRIRRKSKLFLVKIIGAKTASLLSDIITLRIFNK